MGPTDEDARSILELDSKSYSNFDLMSARGHNQVDIANPAVIRQKVEYIDAYPYNFFSVRDMANGGDLVGYSESNNWSKCNQEPLKKMMGSIILNTVILKFEGEPYIINSLVVENDNDKRNETIDILTQRAIVQAESCYIYAIIHQGTPAAGILQEHYGFEEIGVSGDIDGINKSVYKRPPYIKDVSWKLTQPQSFVFSIGRLMKR